MTVEEIKNAVPIEQVLSLMYGLEVKSRMPCPIHKGTHNNFSIKDNFYHCFTCGAGGDIFSLVQEMSETDFIGAKKRITHFFNLPRTQDKEAYKVHLEQIKHERESKLALNKLRFYQQYKICQVLREARTLENDSFLERHLEDLLTRFEQNSNFYIRHDIHAHLNALLDRHKIHKMP